MLTSNQALRRETENNTDLPIRGDEHLLASGDSVISPGRNSRLGFADVFDTRRCFLGEGPVSRAGDDVVWWVDILNCRAHWKSLIGSTTGTVEFHSPVSALLPTVGGDWLVFFENTIDRFDKSFSRSTTLASWPHAEKQITRPRTWRSNDAAVSPKGSVFCGTMPYKPESLPGSAFLYQLDSEGLHEVVDGVTISNGLGWTTDGRKMFYVDTPTRRVDVFDVDEDGRPVNRRPFAEIPPEWGVPDGLAVDSDNHLWVAMWGGSRVQRFSPEGEPSGFVEVPCQQITSCCFAGSDLRQLVITTASVDCVEDPNAGLTYIFETEVPGQVSAPANM